MCGIARAGGEPHRDARGEWPTVGLAVSGSSKGKPRRDGLSASAVVVARHTLRGAGVSWSVKPALACLRQAEQICHLLQALSMILRHRINAPTAMVMMKIVLSMCVASFSVVDGDLLSPESVTIPGAIGAGRVAPHARGEGLGFRTYEYWRRLLPAGGPLWRIHSSSFCCSNASSSALKSSMPRTPHRARSSGIRGGFVNCRMGPPVPVQWGLRGLPAVHAVSTGSPSAGWGSLVTAAPEAWPAAPKCREGYTPA